MMNARERLIEAGHSFERGEGVGGFPRRIELERALFVCTARVARSELGLELSGFNQVALEEMKARLQAIRTSGKSPSQDALVGFELRHQLVTLSLAEPYRFSPTERID